MLVVPGAVAVALGVAYLCLPLMGVDLAAQMARADFARDHAGTPVDFRWFGGTVTFGYSLWVAPAVALLGARVASVIATTAATLALTLLFKRAGSPRPVIAGIVAAVSMSCSLVEGRVAFNIGMALGLWALYFLGRTQPSSRVCAAVLAFLTGTASPVAALLLWVCAGALVLMRRHRDAATILVTSATPVLIMVLLFSEGGRQIFGRGGFTHALVVTLIVAAVLPRSQRLVRWGALLGAVMLIGAYAIHTPVGSNSVRLSILFAIPVVVAFAQMRVWYTTGIVAVLVYLQNPVPLDTLRYTGSADAQSTFYAPLVDEIQSRGPVTGRIEVPELASHWDAVFLARELPLARGWLRQTDVKLNEAYFYSRLNDRSYRRFLDENRVQYVALPKARLTSFGNRERRLAERQPDYLTEEWSNSHWRLYSVNQHRPIVGYPGALVRYDADRIVVDAPPNARISLGIRWFRWLTVDGPGEACITPAGRDVELRTSATGARYTIGSSLVGDRSHC